MKIIKWITLLLMSIGCLTLTSVVVHGESFNGQSKVTVVIEEDTEEAHSLDQSENSKLSNKKKKEAQEKQKKKTKKLPQTNEVLSNKSFIGVGVLAILLFIMYKQKNMKAKA